MKWKYTLVMAAMMCSSLLGLADSKDKTSPNADRYNVTDANGMLAFGKSYYEIDGKPAGANGNFYSTTHSGWSIKNWPDGNTKKHVATYLHFPKCNSGAKIQLTTTGSVTLKLRVTCMENGRELATQTVTIAKGAKQWVEVLDAIDFPQSGWYKFDLECTKGAGYVGEFMYWQFTKTGSAERVYTADYMSSPSVHLSGWRTTDPSAPTPAYYDWVYEEVMVPEESAVVGTYCMSLGVLHGYMGIQIDSDKDYPIIFSMWDNGSTDEDPNLPDYLRSGALDWEKGVTIARFANEGTGAQAKYRTGKNWIPGRWVKFISNARPEVIDVVVDDPKTGGKKTITYTNTLCSAWFMADGLDDDWHYIATIRQSGANNYFDGWYSFLENYNWPTGQWQRKAYYRNGGLHSLSNGRWYHANKVGFGHTDGGSLYGDRRDYGQGKTEEFDDCFFMSTGGYAENPVQNSTVVPLKHNFMPVDQATLDRLAARVDAAIRKEQIVAMKEQVNNACEIYPQSLFKVVAKSDEATNEGAANVATAVFDGNESTYWHSKWSGGEAAYPHTLTVQIQNPEQVRIGQITLVQKRATNYRAKTLTVYTSEDNKTWDKLETLTLEDAERPSVQLEQPFSAPYVKLSFDKGYGGNLLCVNEIYFKSAPSIEDLRQQAADLLGRADQFGGYSSKDLAELQSIYADGRVEDFAVLSAALNNVAANAQPLKFGRVDAMKNLSSFKAYQIHNVDGMGDLVVSEGELSLRSASQSGSLAQYQTALNVTDDNANWLLLHSAFNGNYYLYNIGTGLYLKTGTTCSLVSEPTPINVAYSTGGFTFQSAGAGTSGFLNAAPTSAEAPLKGATASRAGSVWELRDNYYAEPPYELAASILAEMERKVEAEVFQSKAEAAAAFLEQAQKDAALDRTPELAGVYDTAPLAEALAAGSSTTEDIAKAYDAVRASAMPLEGHYYRMISAVRPEAGSMENYVGLSGTGSSQSFGVRNTTEFGPAPQLSTIPEAFRLFTLEKAKNDTTFYLRCAASRHYVLTQTTDQFVSGEAKQYELSYQGERQFRLACGGKSLTVNSSNKLAEVNAPDNYGRFYFKEIQSLEGAISVGARGYGSVCLPAPVVLPEGVEALIVTDIREGVLQLSPLNDYLSAADAGVVPAYVPVILRSADRQPLAPTDCDIYREPLTPLNEGGLSSDVVRAINKANILSGVTCRSSISRNDYVMNDEELSFGKSTATVLVANKVYIAATELPFFFEGILPVGPDGTVGLQLVINDSQKKDAAAVYDLQGRRLTAPVSGVNIVGGRKIMK